MLARDYSYVGSKEFIVEAWGTDETVGEIGSIGSDQDAAITISDKTGNVQVASKDFAATLFSCLPCSV